MILTIFIVLGIYTFIKIIVNSIICLYENKEFEGVQNTSFFGKIQDIYLIPTIKTHKYDKSLEISIIWLNVEYYSCFNLSYYEE